MRRVCLLDVGWHLTVKLCVKCLWVCDSIFLIENSGFLFLLESTWVFMVLFIFRNVRFLFLENVLSEDYFYSLL